jgi:predicted nucleic acid-binding protein
MPEEPEPVVVDTGPLLALAACGQVRTLLDLHPRVLVPRAVVEELSEGGCWPPVGSTEEGFEVRDLQSPLPPLVEAHLHRGEASVLALALELGITRVVVDERRGRQVARTLGLAVTGSIGVLLRAKAQGRLEAVRPCLDAMRKAGVWIADHLVEAVLREAGET